MKEYHHFAVTPSAWFTALTVEQKEKAKRKLRNANVDDICCEKKWMHYHSKNNDLLQGRDRDLLQSKDDKVCHIEDEELQGESETELLQNEEDGSVRYEEDCEPSNISIS